MKLPILVFDFDGVITVRGEALKQEAWEKLFEEASSGLKVEIKKARDRFSDGRGDRYDIIRTALENSGYSRDDIPFLVQLLAREYNRVVQESILNDGIYPETLEALQKLCEAKCRMYINSATPETAVQESCRRLGIDIFFKGIHGTPSSKVFILESISLQNGSQKSDIVFVGDSPGDFKSAEKFGCRFIGVSNDFNKWGEKEMPFLVISFLTELIPFIHKFYE